MFRKLRQAFIVVVGSAVSHGVFADATDGEFYLSPMASYIDENSEKLYDSDTRWHLALGRALGERWNLEGYFNTFEPDGPGAQDQKALGLDLQRVFRRSSRFSPYIFAGLGLMDVDTVAGPSDSSAETGSLGLGFLADLGEDSRVALRGEYRHRWDRAFSESGDDDFVSLGLQIALGDRTKNLDDDQDGVVNLADRCPDTPRGHRVDEYGCSLPIDSDGDGVVDDKDRCPNTPDGIAVDVSGCALDNDTDGVPDYLDQCPDTEPGVSVGSDGCEPDADADGVVDRLDRCPDTMKDAPVDVYGCEIKEEIRLPGVNFETNSDVLVPEASAVLRDAAETLKKNPGIVVEVEGHTDSDGDGNYNQQLSERRALAVRDFITNQGVDTSRLSVRGYGESQPIADNNSAEGKRANRRVVLRILSRGEQR